MKHEVLIYNKTREKIPEKFIKTTITKALCFLKLKQPVEMAVLIVGKNEILRLNKIWRNKNEIPDELSFGLNSRKAAVVAKEQNGVLNLGEIVVNVDKISDKKYLSKILVHALLHLLGYNHKQIEKFETCRAKTLLSV
ncbi:MAG: rRNA maturation RNase YbeY [Candidatus Azambacteria bacterium]|nr:rRNA maturation RNase YbeY [Candidatus Azambacteria bacterium]